MSRDLLHLISFLASSLHLLLIFRFTVLHSLRWHLIYCASIDNRPNNLYLYYFIYTQLHNNLEIHFLLMNALCNFTPYLYYSALISFLVCISVSLYLKTALLRFLYCRDCITPRQPCLFFTKLKTKTKNKIR